MKQARVLFFVFVTFCLGSFLSARDIETHSVENLKSWQDTFDLSSRKAGKYNIMVKATDLSENVTLEGPFNIYLDPDSDLPVCGITNPQPGVRIAGNLNIVGTCVDDDAVEYVDLILDGDEEHPIRAKGKEFWSYYLDTTDLEEGLHTIKVVGCDINGLVGKPVEISWNLDRRQPVTNIDNHVMGTLVSKTVKFHGTVADGNGIKSLSYSVDHGNYFSNVKLSRKKDRIEFDISVDTKKFPDGPAVIWFKAVDNAGSEGIYSFLYFIDNTSPDVKILQPAEKVPQYGKVAIAGYAKDTVGISKLHWTFGKESGDFEIVPGNPFWAKEFDLAGVTEKSRKFTISATDAAGNTITVSQNVAIDESLDRPDVKIAFPTAESLVESGDVLYVRGIATDRDGIASVKYRLDNGEWIEEETKGVFYGVLAQGSELSAGKHTVSVIATDRHGVQSKVVTSEFQARGALPEFSEAKIAGTPVVNGIKVHPESGASFTTTVSSSVGLASVHVETRWGSKGIKQNDYELNSAGSYTVNIPINDEFPKGIAKIYISATDIVGRTRNYKAMIDVENTSVVQGNEAKIVFDDGVIDENGVIQVNKEFPPSAYFIGGTARSVEIVPKTSFVTARLSGNQIILAPGDVNGSSEPVVVRVTTDQGLAYDSQKIVFKQDTAFPRIRISEISDVQLLDASSGNVKVSGSVSCDSGIGSLSYRVFTSRAAMNAGVVNSMESVSAGEVVPLTAGRSFSISLDTSAYGIYFVEVTAESVGGNKSSEVVGFKNIPPFPEDGKGSPKAPMVVWADGENVYAGAAYQGETVRSFEAFKRSEMKAGSNALQMSVEYADGKNVSSKFNANKTSELKAAFVKAGDKNYASGIPVVLAKGSKSSVIAYVDSGVQVSASYEISGEDVPGGASRASGSASVSKSEEKENRWIVEIPLENLPVRLNKIKLSVKAGSASKDLYGTVATVRPIESSMIDDRRSVYAMEASGSKYDSDTGCYILRTDEVFSFYANVPELVSADFVTAVNGLKLERQENLVKIIAEKEGSYSGVAVRVKDSNGISYTSATVNFIVDNGAPEVKIVTPEIHQWVKKSLRITGTVADPSGVKSAEYSLDKGEIWKTLNLSSSGRSAVGATFSGTADISSAEDGLIELDVRVYDVAGNVSYARTAAYKDVTPPVVEVVVPNDDATVNGDNLICFNVYDNASFEKAFYIAPPTGKASGARIALTDVSETFVSTHIGTLEKPIDDGMSFEFVDAAGNVSSYEAWKFLIDSKSDLPIAEIHLPTYEDVVTRDFTISGVVYDDDGPSSIYYKIDNGSYTKLAEMGTSFAIDVPFSTMTDNEHTISVYAVDINGVKGPVVERKFRVSTEEPKGAVETPTIDKANKGLITLTGVASDKNGIEKVLVSLDNGNSYNNAVGTTSWTYTFDSRAIPNGTSVVFIRVIDKYGISGLYSSLINIDNKAPELVLDYPLDYSATTGPLFFSGYAFDNVDITDLFITVRSLDGKTIPRSLQKVDFKLDRIITKNIDISALENGSYNIELTALDKAQNATRVSRNIMLNKNKPLATVNLLYPLNGEHKQGTFNIYGSAEADNKIESLSLYIDNKFVAVTTLTASDYFKFEINPEIISDGEHTYRVDAKVESGQVIRSRTQTVEYNSVGPWITIDNFTYGDFATGRPYIKGHAGYSLSEEEKVLASTKKATKEQKETINNKKVAKIEISFDNGKTFTQVSKGEKWMYRVENQDIGEGFHFMIVRATMRNGETAIERTIIQIDNTAPKIRLITPSVGGRYNQELVFSGLSSDTVGLKDVQLTLRKGDKASYEVPSFIQGLYLDWHFWGATLFDIGVGLTFFDDVVKVQFQWGQFTQAQRDMFSNTSMRYGGDNVMGIKILANVANVPFSYFFGRDFDWLSANFAVGAQFSRFNESGSGEAQILSAILAQLEFPKVKFPKMKCFSSLSLYTEFSLWFIPTDVSSTNVDINNIVPQIAEGIRLSVF